MGDWLNQHPTLFGSAFVIAFILIGWPLSLYAASHFSGWSTLQRTFGFEGVFEGQSSSFQSGYLRFMSYRNVLTVGSDSNGLYLAPTLSIFSAGHQPLLIPWSQVSFTRTQIMFLRWVSFYLGRDASIPFSVSGTLADKLQSAAGRNWPLETFR